MKIETTAHSDTTPQYIDPASVHRTRWAFEHPEEYKQWRREHLPESSFWQNVWQFLKEAW